MEKEDRLRQVTDRLAFAVAGVVTDLRITDDEWRAGIGFLTRVAATGEFVLLSDALHLSVLVDAITHGADEAGGTVSDVEGPFYKPGAPMLERPYRIATEDEPGDPLFVTGSVTDAVTGEAVPGAVLDVWQANDAGMYDTQEPTLGEFHLRGRMAVDRNGAYEFRTVLPPPYEIPKEGPVGQLLRALGRHAFRPAHLHLKVAAAGYAPLTTMVFFEGDDYLGSDTIGAVKDSLITRLEWMKDASEIAARGLDHSFVTCRFDIRLSPSASH